MNARQGDIIVGVSSLALVVYLYIATNDMPEGPAGFPRLIALGFLVCGLILLARALLNKTETKLIFADINWPIICTLGACWMVVIWLVTSLGFLIPGSVFIAVMAWFLMGRPKETAEIARIGLFTVGMTVGLWIVFHKLLGVETPAGQDWFLF